MSPSRLLEFAQDVGPSEIGADCRSADGLACRALHIWNFPLPTKSLSMIGRPAWPIAGVNLMDDDMAEGELSALALNLG